MCRGSRGPCGPPPGTASSMRRSGNGSHAAGLLDALLADALSQDEHETHQLPAGEGWLPHAQHSGSRDRMRIEGVAEAAGEGSQRLAVSRPGSSRKSLVDHYLQRGRDAQLAATRRA